MNNSNYSDNYDEGFILDDIFKRLKENTFDLDSIMVIVVHGGHSHGAEASHLQKYGVSTKMWQNARWKLQPSRVLGKIILNSRVAIKPTTICLDIST